MFIARPSEFTPAMLVARTPDAVPNHLFDDELITVFFDEVPLKKVQSALS